MDKRLDSNLKNKPHKYQREYETSTCFWGKRPAKYVKLLASHIGNDLSAKRVLDLGAGEGKNAVFLANMGADVVGVDLSLTALSRFSAQPNFDEAAQRLETICADVTRIRFDEGRFDIVVAYGILHCLNNVEQVEDLVQRIKRWVASGGYFVGATFTNELPVPEVQEYLDEESFLPRGRFQELFNNWVIIYEEDDVISEVHPTSQTEHKHSICRIIAQKQ